MAKQQRRLVADKPKVHFAGNVVIVDRSKCKLERVWTPARTREGIEAARMQVSQDSLQEDETAFFEPPSSGSSGYVNVWICRLEDLPPGSTQSTIWIPESFLKEPGADGPRLVECKHGYEGQIWEDKALISTRWWPGPPDQTAWQLFIEGTDAGVGLPTVLSVDWLEVPSVETIGWRKNLSLFSLGKESLQRAFAPERIAAAAFVLLALPFGYLAGAEIKTQRLAADVAATLAPLVDKNRAIETAQSQAFEARAFSTAMQERGTTIALVDALSEVPAAAGGKPVTIIFVGLTENQLEVHLSGVDAAAVPDIVTKLDSSETWKNVSGAVNRNGHIVLKGSMGETVGGS